MSRQTFRMTSQPAGIVELFCRIRGAGAAAPLIELGPNGEPDTAALAVAGQCGFTIARNAAGDYTLTFSELPGKVYGWRAQHARDVPGSATARSVQFDWDSNNPALDPTALAFRQLRLFVTDPGTEAAAPAAVDLAANDKLWISIYCKTSSGKF
jgi:hypothetical protein